MKKKYVTREFTVMKKSDYEEFLSEGEFNYNTCIAKMYNNYDVEVEGKILSNDDFNKIYTINLP